MHGYLIAALFAAALEPRSEAEMNETRYRKGAEDLVVFADAAEAAAKGDPYAERLVKLFRERVKPAFRDANGAPISKHGFDDDDSVTAFIFTTRERLRAAEDQVQCEICYCVGEGGFGAFQFVIDDPWDLQFLGVVLLHEMVHWDDYSLSRRFPPIPEERRTALVETRAHKVSDAALRRMLGPKYGRAVRLVLANPKLSALLPGTKLRFPRHAGLELIAGTWNSRPGGKLEIESRGHGMMMSILLQQAKTESARVAAYLVFMRRNEEIHDIHRH